MITPSIRRAASFAFVLASASVATPGFAQGASAQEAKAESGDHVSPLPRGPRFGLIPGAGGGVGGFTNAPSYYPGFVGLTFTQVEVLAEIDRWGGFLRGAFYSSGQDGRWTAPSIAGGATYRFFGDGEKSWGLVGRGGLIWQNWHASTAGCDIKFFIPENCKASLPPPVPGVIQVTTPIYSTTVSTFGLLAGARLELPVSGAYMAFGGELVGVADLSQASPGVAIEALFSFSISFRSRNWNGETVDESIERARYRERNK